MRKVLLFGAIGLATLFLAAAQTMMGMNGYVRVVHAISDAPAVDVFLSSMGKEIQTVKGAPYTGVTPYGDVPVGKYNVLVTVAKR